MTGERQEESMCRVIAVANQKGGVGKTTTIGKLAGKLRSQNKKVVLAAARNVSTAAGEQLNRSCKGREKSASD